MSSLSLSRLGVALLFLLGTIQATPALPVPIVPPVGATFTPHRDVYLVYSGTSSISSFSTADGYEIQTNPIYLVFDLAHPSNYSVLVVGPGATGGYYISTRVLSADGASVATYDQGVADSSDPTENFNASLVHLAAFKTFSGQLLQGQAALQYTVARTSEFTAGSASHVYPEILQTYATGPLHGLTSAPQVLIPANGSSSGAFPAPHALAPFNVDFFNVPYTNLIGARADDATVVPYFTALSGISSGYAYDATLLAKPSATFAPLARITTSGNVSVALDPALSALANVGGSCEFPSHGPIILPLSLVLKPIDGPLTPNSASTTYESFLYQIVFLLGLNSNGGYVPGTVAVDPATK